MRRGCPWGCQGLWGAIPAGSHSRASTWSGPPPALPALEGMAQQRPRLLNWTRTTGHMVAHGGPCSCPPYPCVSHRNGDGQQPCQAGVPTVALPKSRSWVWKWEFWNTHLTQGSGEAGDGMLNLADRPHVPLRGAYLFGFGFETRGFPCRKHRESQSTADEERGSKC